MATNKDLSNFTNQELKVFSHEELQQLTLEELVEHAESKISAITKMNTALGVALNAIQKLLIKLVVNVASDVLLQSADPITIWISWCEFLQAVKKFLKDMLLR